MRSRVCQPTSRDYNADLKFRFLLKAWFPVALWMTLMFFGSTDLMSASHTSRFLTPFLRWLDPDVSAEAILRAHFFVRKTAHLTEYAILTALLFRGWRSSLSAGRATVAAFGLAMFFAVGDEFHQTFIASRTGAIGDVLIDGSGALLSVLICWTFGFWRRTSPHNAEVVRVRSDPPQNAPLP